MKIKQSTKVNIVTYEVTTVRFQNGREETESVEDVNEPPESIQENSDDFAPAEKAGSLAGGIRFLSNRVKRAKAIRENKEAS